MAPAKKRELALGLWAIYYMVIGNMGAVIGMMAFSPLGALDLPGALANACPDGIDVYFENVGGAIWQAVLPLLNLYARVPVCGLISQYSGADDARLAATMRAVLTQSLTLRGFINYEFAAEHYPTFLAEVSAGIGDGRISYREDVTDGLASAPAAFLGLLEGKNFGKALVRVST